MCSVKMLQNNAAARESRAASAYRSALGRMLLAGALAMGLELMRE